MNATMMPPNSLPTEAGLWPCFDETEDAAAESEDRPGQQEDTQPCTFPAQVKDTQLQQWIQRIVRQDEAAFADLYEAIVGRVYGLALRITRDRALAEEVTEDSFWQVWRQAPRYDKQRGTALAWILTMTRSRALDALRTRDPAESMEDPGLLLDLECARDCGGLEQSLGARQEGHRLHDALEKLDAQPRQLIALTFFRGLTHDEIAAHTGIPLGTVKSHIRRGLATLRSLLENGSSMPEES